MVILSFLRATIAHCLTYQKKAIADMPPRVERFFLRLLKYDYTLTFVPGKQMAMADMLSRAPASEDGAASPTSDVEVHGVTVVSALVSEKTISRLASETERDVYLQQVLHKLANGCAVEGPLRAVASELSVVKGILLKGTKVVVPSSMQLDIIKRVHAGHLGIRKWKARARQFVYWPNLNSDIERLVRKCSVCHTYAYRQPPEPLIMPPTPTQAWYRVGVDFFQHGGQHYLCAYEAMSNFPEVELIPSTTASSMIQKLGAIFYRYGIPIEVCTDNGPQFASSEFRLFAQQFDFKHIISSPEYPQSNGLAEKGVQIIKRILKKTKAVNENFWLGVLNYRTSPLEDGGSPAERLQGRRLPTPVPDFGPLVSTRVRKHRQSKHNRRVLPDLRSNDSVRIRGKTWIRKAKVPGSAGPRCFHVRTEDRNILRRNRQHLLATSEPFEDTSDEEDYDEQEVPASVESPLSGSPTVVPSCPQPPLQPVLPQRRSQRQTRHPERLGYDQNFQ